jgi:hypothetical protein
MPALILSSSVARCGMPPSPVEAKTSLPGWSLGERDQLGQGLRRHALADHEDLRHRRDLRDEAEILERAKGHALAQA